VTLTTYCGDCPDGGVGIVVQAFVPIWRWPTHVSVGAVGHMFAEGVVLATDDTISEMPEEWLWPFRSGPRGGASAEARRAQPRGSP
jgi:hypothetical protein